MTEPTFGEPPNQTYVTQVPQPRFDFKVALTTRGWSWEVEVKDVRSKEEAEGLLAIATACVTQEMDKHVETPS